MSSASSLGTGRLARGLARRVVSAHPRSSPALLQRLHSRPSCCFSVSLWPNLPLSEIQVISAVFTFMQCSNEQSWS